MIFLLLPLHLNLGAAGPATEVGRGFVAVADLMAGEVSVADTLAGSVDVADTLSGEITIEGPMRVGRTFTVTMLTRDSSDALFTPSTAQLELRADGYYRSYALSDFTTVATGHYTMNHTPSDPGSWVATLTYTDSGGDAWVGDFGPFHVAPREDP